MFKCYLFSLFIAFVLLSCATKVDIQKSGFESPSRAEKVITNYEINKPHKKTVAENIVELQRYRVSVQNVYFVLSDYTPPGNITYGECPPLRKGSKFIKYGVTSQGTIVYSDEYYIKGYDGSTAKIGIEIDSKGVILRAPVYLLDSPIVPKGTLWDNKKLFEYGKDTIITEGRFKATLSYSGKSGNNIKLSYREYYDNKARDAFSREMEYNLDESKIIAFRSLQIEVIQATNSFIEFKVLSEGSLDWVVF